jgi:lipopolysaccharide transport system ATP-binding protein
VKRYSSGMAVRLGFAVAAFIEPDVLLVDEVLAVGDTEFRNRCHNRMSQMLNKGVTMILVSHNLAEVRNLCDKTLMLWKGERLIEGPTAKVVEEYHQRVVEMIKVDQAKDAERDGEDEVANDVEVTRVEFLDKNGMPGETFLTGEPMTVRVHYHAKRRVERPHVCVDLDWAAEDTLATSCDTERDGFTLAPIVEGKGHIDCRLGQLLMEPNVYSVNVRIRDGATETLLGSIQRQRFILNEQEAIHGLFGLAHKWEQPRPGESEPGAKAASVEAA